MRVFDVVIKHFQGHGTTVTSPIDCWDCLYRLASVASLGLLRAVRAVRAVSVASTSSGDFTQYQRHNALLERIRYRRYYS